MVYPSFFPYGNSSFQRGFNPYGMQQMMRPMPVPPTRAVGNFGGPPQAIPRAINNAAQNFARGGGGGGNFASMARAAGNFAGGAARAADSAGNFAGAAEATGAAAAVGGAGALGGFAKIEQYLNTADQLFNTAQKFTPMVKQISPMFQNLPALYRLYKGFRSIPNANGPTNAAGTAQNGDTQQRRPMRFRFGGNGAPPPTPQPETQAQTFTPRTRPSTPRIFQPPFDA